MDGADLTPRCRSALIRLRWFCAFEAAGKSKPAVAVCLLGLMSVATAFASFPACAQSVAQALQEITDTVDRLCGNVATSGQTNAASGAAEVKAELNGLAKRLADLGVSASGSTSSSTYEGVIQQELPTALRDVRECKLKVFQTLQEKLLPDAQSTPRSALGAGAAKTGLRRQLGQPGRHSNTQCIFRVASERHCPLFEPMER